MKKIFSLFLIIITPSLFLFAQKCSYAKNTIDEFSKKREVITSSEVLYNKTNITSFGITGIEGNRWQILVSALSVNGENSLKLAIGAYERDLDLFTKIDLLMEDNEVISLNSEAHPDNYFSDSWHFMYIFYHVSESVWNQLKTTAVKKVRIYYEGVPSVTVEIKASNSRLIGHVINCIDALNIPKSSSQNTPNATTRDNIDNKKGNNKEIPKPTKDTTTVTLHKQWKYATQIDSSGSLVDLKYTYIVEYANNGTYKSTVILKEGTVYNLTGKFQLLNDNKILVMTQDGVAKSTSYIITKLTKTELHTLYNNSEHIYVAY